jgi:hypothetical protein
LRRVLQHHRADCHDQEAGHPIFFEHDLGRLATFLSTGTYYDAPWDPAGLFTDVPADEVQAALDKIQTAPVDAGEAGEAGSPAEDAEGA